VYVRVFGQPHAQGRARPHTCSCIRYERMETLHVWDPSVVGSQAFTSASAFNANIGAWNTASVTSMTSVCAVSAVACSAAKSCARSGYKCLYAHVAIEMVAISHCIPSYRSMYVLAFFCICLC
jgi:surface protein